MADPTLTQTTLALFTSAEKAEEIEGDLIEQAATHGRWWYLLQIKLTAVALFFHTLFQEPGKHLLLGYAVYELLLKVNWWLLEPMRWFLIYKRDWTGWPLPLDSMFNACAGFIVGMVLVRLFPKAGATIGLISMALVLARVFLLQGQTQFVMVVIFALIPLVFLVLGLLTMKWLELRHRNKTLVAS